MNQDSDDTWTSDAIGRGDVNAIRQRVLEEPGYLDSRDYVGDTPLLAAIAFNHLELVQFLLKQGADPNVSVDDGYTCLLTAIESDAPQSQAIVAALISAGADVHQTGINGWTPLHMAAARGHVGKARLLIAAGANVNQRIEIDAEETPLMEAALTGQPEMVKLLLDHGADASLRDSIGRRTPIEIARDAAAGPDPGVHEFLQQENIRVDFDELFAGMDLPSDQLAMMKQSFANQDFAESYLENASELAETGKHAEVIRILSQHDSSA